MNERELLLRAVCENPDEDTPRLAFADWLQEYGNESERARAEFIRLQVHMAQLKGHEEDDWPYWQRLCQCEQELRLAHDEEWWAELPDAPGYRLGRMFKRGFIDHVFAFEWEAFVRDAEVILSSGPVTGISVSGQVDLTRPATLAVLARFRSIRFDSHLEEPDLFALLDAPLPRLEYLALDHPSGPTGLLRDQLQSRFGERVYFFKPWR